MTGERQRLRVIHTLKPLGSSWSLSEIEVHKESWDADYNGGKELRGEAIEVHRRASCEGKIGIGVLMRF
jgi:hypothetical protein